MAHHSMNFFDDSSRDLHVQTRRHLRGLIARALVFFAEHETDNLRRVREHLLHVMDGKPSVGKSQNLRSAYVLLDKQGEAFNLAFRAAIQATIDEEALLAFPDAALAPVQKKAVPHHALDGMSLSLIDMNEVDRILLLDRVTQRFNAHFEPSLTPLTKRLSALLDLNAPNLSRNPFRPEIFVRAFLLAWERSALDPQATDDLMLSIEPQHVMDLAPLYTELNQVLTEAGVADKPTLRIRREVERFSSQAPLAPASHSAAPTVTQHPNFLPHQAMAHPHALGHTLPSAASSAPSAWQGLAPVGRSLAAQARQFLQRLGLVARPVSAAVLSAPSAAPSSAPDTTAPNDAFAAPQSTDADAGESEFVGEMSGEVMQNGLQTVQAADPEFMGYLGNLQAGEVASFSPSMLSGQNPSDRNILRQMRDMEQVRRAPDLDRGTVDALAEVFDYVFADQSIPVQMKFVIGRLQVPVLKAAMIDRDFFLSSEHPARRLVDTLAHASIAWAPEKGEDDPLYEHIQRTVQRVLNEFEDDLSLFRDLLQSFNEFLFETEQQAQGRIEPTADQERTGEAFDHALAHADEMVHARLKALPKSLPLANFLVPFLAQQWREVLAQAWLVCDSNRQPWEDALQTMDELIWSTQPKTTVDERRQLVSVLPGLVRGLNAGLDAIAWNELARAKFTRRLITTHTLAIRMTQAPAQDTVSAALEERAGQEALQALDARLANQLSDSKDEFDSLAQTFNRGMWFDFTHENGKQHRCRLSWVSPMRTRMLFTNREGFDAFVRSEREVAAMLRHQRLCTINQTPIVARALNHILASEDEALAA
ncbi:MAG: hypothetical protein CO065_07025 [Comamonadaceae bacterium CG_4_9_14_0_8_um_filter_57_21]|nr:MAG: hypothetical protein COY49_04940 [Comamonadaceae bacterium CG_4_10_14_0_8_um_filter_57_29]PJC19873.1 MAG: hypothetical protein CO065_07025 [Comamonadaceae bacterium CG_4_9_14_0_8_um_filter_57_21]